MRQRTRRINATMRGKEREYVQRRYGVDRQPYGPNEYFSSQVYEDVREVRGTVGTSNVVVSLLPAGQLTKFITLNCPATSPNNLFIRITPINEPAVTLALGGCVRLVPGQTKTYILGREFLNIIGAAAGVEYEITYGW